jgi:hypothetical protein
MVGRHDDRSALNVYRRLYGALGIKDPPKQPRDKPPCCGDNAVPPEYGPVAKRLESGAARFFKPKRRATRRGRRGKYE